MYHDRLPLVPSDILQAHMVHEPGDTRFKAAARLLQALWRAERGIPIGTHAPANGEPRKLGSRIEASCRIPDDHRVACETDAGVSDTTLSSPASAYCS